MSVWLHWICLWLADYYLSATILLAAVLAIGTVLREPVQRMSLAWGTLVGLPVLALLCAAPFWPRLSIVKSADEIVSAAAPREPTPATPIPTVALPPLQVRSPAPNIGALPQPVEYAEFHPPKVAPVARAAKPLDFSLLVAAIFLIGSAAMMLWLMVGAIYSRRLCRTATPAPKFVEQELQAITHEISLSPGERVGVRGLPRLLLSRLIHTAAAYGLLRPAILLPEDVLTSEHLLAVQRGASPAATRTSLSASASLRTLLAHEFAHIQRRDLWLLASSRLLLVVLLAHPLYWLLRGRIRADQELIADAIAAEVCGRHQYAENLVHWARRQPTALPRLAGALGIWERPSQLSRRIATLLDDRIRLQVSCTRRWRFSVFALTTASIVAVSLLTLRPMPAAKAETPSTTKADAPHDVFSADTPDDQVIARIGTEVIRAGELRFLVREVIRRKGLAISKDEEQNFYAVAGRPLLKQLIERKRIYQDAIHNIPAVGLSKIESNVNAEFDNVELPKLFKENSAAAKQELDHKLHERGGSLEAVRKSFIEKAIYGGWLAERIKDLDESSTTPALKEKDRARQVQQYLAKLRQQTTVWTIYDDQPGGLDGPAADKPDAAKNHGKRDSGKEVERNDESSPDVPAVVPGPAKPANENKPEPKTSSSSVDRGVDIVVQRAGGTATTTNGLPEELGKQIEKLKGVDHVIGGLLDMVSFPDKDVVSALLNGWPPGCPLFERLKIQSGRQLAAGDKNKIVLGRELARQLDKKVGDELELYNSSPFEVIGIYESPIKFENNGAVLPLAELQQMMNRPGEVTGFAVVAKRPIDAEGLKDLAKRIELYVASLHRDDGSPLQVKAAPVLQIAQVNKDENSHVTGPVGKKDEPAAKQPPQSQAGETPAGPPAKKQIERTESDQPSSATTEPPKALPAAPDDAKLLQRVIDGIQANYAQLKTVQGTLEMLVIDPSVDQRTTSPPPKNPPKDGYLTITQAPVTVIRNVFTIQGDNLRSEESERQKDGWKHNETNVRRGDKWTRLTFYDDFKKAMVGRADQLGASAGTKDPRNLGALSDYLNVLDQLRRSKIVVVTQREPLLQIRTEIVDAPKYGYHKGQQFTYVFDPARNFLPVSIISHHDDGSLAHVMEFTYDAVLPGKAWFLRQLTDKAFLEKGILDVGSDRWFQFVLYRITGDLKVNQPVKDDVFLVQPPAA